MSNLEDSLNNARNAPLPPPPIILSPALPGDLTAVFTPDDYNKIMIATTISSALKSTSNSTEKPKEIENTPIPSIIIDAPTSTIEEGENKSLITPREKKEIHHPVGLALSSEGNNNNNNNNNKETEVESVKSHKRHSRKKQDGESLLLTLSDIDSHSPLPRTPSRAVWPPSNLFRPLGSQAPIWATENNNNNNNKGVKDSLEGQPPVTTPNNNNNIDNNSIEGNRGRSKGNFSRLIGSNSTIPTMSTSKLSLKILGMSPLHPDPSVVHPFVRVWLVNNETGENLIQVGFGRDHFALTHPVDLRLRRTRAPWWGAELILKIQSSVLDNVSSKAVLLLEVLDSGVETIQGFQVRRDGLYPVCWGFVKLYDEHGRSNIKGRLNIQMFPFPQRTSFFTKFMQILPSFFLPFKNISTKSENFIPISTNLNLDKSNTVSEDFISQYRPPELFFIYKDYRNRKVPYNAGMLISLKKITSDFYLPKEANVLPYEEYLLNQMSVNDEMRPKSSISVSIPFLSLRQGKKFSHNLVNTMALLKSYIREKGERVNPPSDVLQRVKFRGKVTCMSFSNDSAIFAIGVSIEFKYIIQLRNALIPEIPIVATFHGHVGHIHHIVFRSDDKLLLSCSSDKTVKLWSRDSSSLDIETSSDEQIGCICTLSHSFPIYSGIFYQDHIITCGYDPRLFVWRYVEEENNLINNSIQNSRGRSINSLGSSLPTMVPIYSSSVNYFHGELIYETTNDESKAIILSICATELNRIWSVDALSNVIVWRAMYEKMKDGKRVWQMTQRHKFKCQGATKVEVYGNTALVTCEKLSIAYIFDVPNHQLIHEINLHQRPYIPALTLLPDGEAILAGTVDGKILCWECNSGTLCTPRNGYNKIQVNFSIGSILWSKNQQLGIILSTNGNSENSNDSNLPRFTLAAVIGTPRTEESIIFQSNPRAPDLFRARFGGELTARRTSRTAPRESFVAFLGDSSCRSNEKKSNFTTINSRETLSGDKSTRMGQIIAMWKGLVGQHKRDRVSGDNEMFPRDPTAVYHSDIV